MAESLARKIGETGQDNLIAKLYPPVETFGVTIASGQGKLARGSVLTSGADGYTLLDAAATGKANCVLADPVDATSSAVTGVAYRTGHLNANALIVAEGYELTAADREELRKGGILLSEMLD